MNDTERLERLDLWLRENGVDHIQTSSMNIREWIDRLPPHECEPGEDSICRHCGAGAAGASRRVP